MTKIIKGQEMNLGKTIVLSIGLLTVLLVLSYAVDEFSSLGKVNYPSDETYSTNNEDPKDNLEKEEFFEAPYSGKEETENGESPTEEAGIDKAKHAFERIRKYIYGSLSSTEKLEDYISDLERNRKRYLEAGVRELTYDNTLALALRRLEIKDAWFIVACYLGEIKCTEEIRSNHDRYDKSLKRLKEYSNNDNFLIATQRKGLKEWLEEVGIYGADTKNQPSEQLLRAGEHAITLQWISWDHPGKVWIKPIAVNRYSVNGKQMSRMNGDYLRIDGVITPKSKRELIFEGTIKYLVSHNNNGEECVKKGRQVFRSYGKRKYWRLQNMMNCDGIVTDYVDIYF
jgi:hypothetical protein